ncbi:MAG: hypothetical protein M3Y87_32930 [Myxococcota bacterium]|nr:hypothetical protein [Myxococcota bacterium]
MTHPSGKTTPPGAADPASGAQPMQVSRFVRETLEAYASEALADAILRRAMSRAERVELPTSGSELRDLVDGHLLDAARDALGDEHAEEIHAQLGALVQVVLQIERATAAAPGVATASTALSAEDRAPTVELMVRPFSVVLVLGHDPDVVARMRPHLDERTAAIPVQDTAVLLRDLRLLRQHSRMLIVDQRRPHALLDAVRSEPALLDRAAIVLWGARRELENEVRQTFPRATVVRCGPDATVVDLASLVRLGAGR